MTVEAACEMGKSAAMIAFEAETGLREGPVPAALDDAALTDAGFQITRDAFLLRLPTGLAFHYARGAGTAYRRPDTVSDAEVALFFEGSVYGAIAWINGLVPLHASAVVHDGRVHAFTGVSGEGKSTLVAALGGRGLGMFCDDVLLLDLSEPGQVLALPGHKRLKLWSDALALTGQAGVAAVRPGLDKFYVADRVEGPRDPLPLATLYLLGSTADQPMAIEPIAGARRFDALHAAYYRPRFCAAVVDPARYFEITARLAAATRIARFNRSRDTARFGDGLDMIAADIRG